MNRTEKAAAVERVKAGWEGAKGVVLVDFRGVTVAQITGLRKKLRKQGVSFNVVQNTLAKRAIKDFPGAEAISKLFVGPTAVAFSPNDGLIPVRILHEARKEIEKLKLKGAVVDGQLYESKELEVIATLPSREELISRLAGGLASPISGFAGSLAGLLSKFARTIDAVRELKEKQGPAPAAEIQP